MSMNRYMHPRNIYKEPPNFKQLALDFPDFRKHTTQDISGKIIFDFQSNEALRALSCALMKKDFGIDLQIPINKLIPTIPLRLNYILWIEDLLNIATSTENIKGIDIGTGASCIYPLIAAKKNGWSFLATEVDPESINCAVSNVKTNFLAGKIEVIPVNGETLLLGVLNKVPDAFDFCMCNPPFFGHAQELNPLFKARNASRPRPKNAFCATFNEVVAKGGEVEYVARLITESGLLKTRIKIFSSMVGKKSSLPFLKKLLRQIDVASFKQTEFCQGNTTRWGLAWTFLDIDLRKIPNSAKEKHPKPLRYEIPANSTVLSEYKLSIVAEKVVELFKALQMQFLEVKHVKNLVEFIVTAEANTWSNQRRKRRELERLNRSGGDTSNNNMEGEVKTGEIGEACDKMAAMEMVGGKKRCLDDDNNDDDEFYNAKKFRNDANQAEVSVFLKALISIVQIGSVVGLEMVFLDGSASKEGLHQVLQFFKNKFEAK